VWTRIKKIIKAALQLDRRKLTVLGSECPAVCVYILADIILLRQVEKLPDLGGPFGSPHPGLLGVSQTRQIILTLLDNHQVDNREVLADNATTDRLPPALTITPTITTEAWSAYRTHNKCSAKNIYKKRKIQPDR